MFADNQKEARSFQFVPMQESGNFPVISPEEVPVATQRNESHPIVLNGCQLTKDEIEAIDQDPFWLGIQDVGNGPKGNHEQIVEMIKRRHPVAWYLPDPRKNRRNLYRSISYLRNHSSNGWAPEKIGNSVRLPQGILGSAWYNLSAPALMR